jgi:hypothetical protein
MRSVTVPVFSASVLAPINHGLSEHFNTAVAKRKEKKTACSNFFSLQKKLGKKLAHACLHYIIVNSFSQVFSEI